MSVFILGHIQPKCQCQYVLSYFCWFFYYMVAVFLQICGLFTIGETKQNTQTNANKKKNTAHDCELLALLVLVGKVLLLQMTRYCRLLISRSVIWIKSASLGKNRRIRHADIKSLCTEILHSCQKHIFIAYTYLYQSQLSHCSPIDQLLIAYVIPL